VNRPDPEMSSTCFRCKGPLWRQRIGTTEGLINCLYCPICGHFVQLEERRPERRPAGQRRDALVQCKVEGCPQMVQAATTLNGRCHVCNRAMREWNESAKRKPAPIITVAGVEIFNPDRKPRKPRKEKS